MLKRLLAKFRRRPGPTERELAEEEAIRRQAQRERHEAEARNAERNAPVDSRVMGPF
jgi:hypothetical protein